MPLIRPEAPEDFDAVRELNRGAFGQDAEGRLVDLLHESGDGRRQWKLGCAGSHGGHAGVAASRCWNGIDAARIGGMSRGR